MELKFGLAVLFLLAVLIDSSKANPALHELKSIELQLREQFREKRQTPSIDSCVLGCIVNAVRNVGMTNLRPSSWSWNLSELLQSAVLRTYCDAYNYTRTCIDSCSFSGSKILVGAVMGVPGLLCTGGSGATACLQNASKSVQSTCDNKCGDLKPSFGLRTWMSLTKMSNIFNDMCAYWGCQLACGKPAVERQCGQESVTLMNRISGIGLDTLKDALKSAGLSSVCGANATRVPNTYEIRTDAPIIDGGGDNDYGGGDDNRPPTDDQEGGGDGDGGQGGGGETGISLGDQRGGRGGGGGRIANGSSTMRPMGRGQTGGSSTVRPGRGEGGNRGGGGQGGSGQGGRRGGASGRGNSGAPNWLRVVTTTVADEGRHLGDEDYWQAVGGGGRGGQDGRGNQGNRGSTNQGRRGQGNNDDDVPAPRNTGSSDRQNRQTSFSVESEGLGDLNQKRRPMRVTTTEASGRGSRRGSQDERRRDEQLPSMRVGDTDRRTGEVHLKLGD